MQSLQTITSTAPTTAQSRRNQTTAHILLTKLTSVDQQWNKSRPQGAARVLLVRHLSTVWWKCTTQPLAQDALLPRGLVLLDLGKASLPNSNAKGNTNFNRGEVMHHFLPDYQQRPNLLPPWETWNGLAVKRGSAMSRLTLEANDPYNKGHNAFLSSKRHVFYLKTVTALVVQFLQSLSATSIPAFETRKQVRSTTMATVETMTLHITEMVCCAN